MAIETIKIRLGNVDTHPRITTSPDKAESQYGQMAGSHRKDVIFELSNIVSEISPAKMIQYQHSDLHPCFKKFPQNKGHCFDHFPPEFRKAEVTKCSRSRSQFTVNYSHSFCLIFYRFYNELWWCGTHFVKKRQIYTCSLGKLGASSSCQDLIQVHKTKAFA